MARNDLVIFKLNLT